MSPLRRQALELAAAELRRRGALRSLSSADRRAVERLAATVAEGVAGAVESAAASSPALARALAEVVED